MSNLLFVQRLEFKNLTFEEREEEAGEEVGLGRSLSYGLCVSLYPL
jgi:hypothetical protein